MIHQTVDEVVRALTDGQTHTQTGPILYLRLQPQKGQMNKKQINKHKRLTPIECVGLVSYDSHSPSCSAFHLQKIKIFYINFSEFGLSLKDGLERDSLELKLYEVIMIIEH